MKKLSMLLLLSAGLLFSCKKNKPISPDSVKETLVNVGNHNLMTYSVIKNSKYLVVLESGLGDGHESWNPTGKSADILELANDIQSDIVLYDRGGYGKSGNGLAPRDINQLRTELEKVIENLSGGRKVVLVGHSVGGLITRDYAIKNSSKTAGLLFVDPSHESFNQPTQAIEDQIYGVFSSAYGVNSGAATEARQLIEDLQYTATLPNLPNIPVIVLTSMKHDDANNITDATYHKTRQDWYNAHELLKRGVNDFTHVTTTAAGHYIHQEDPDLFLKNLKLLLSKLP
ncbi:pimeloyl-ACP methyl ester carboxylesterase [Pedobacter sp. UYP24]